MQFGQNFTANLTRSYVFLPVDLRIKLTIYFCVGGFSLYAVFANGLILYFKRRQNLQRKGNQRRRAFDRFVVTSTFVQSLVISDFLCAIVSLPLAFSTNLVDLIDTDLKCKTVRFVNIFFPVVTIGNLFVIGMERYLAVFHPFRVPSCRVVKTLVVCAWVLSGLITLVPAYTFRLLRRDVGPDKFTVVCVYDKSTPIYKVMFLSFTIFIYVLPAIILTFTNIRILLHLKRRKLHNSVRRNSWRFYGTVVFVALIFSFIIPYFLFVLFSGLNMVMKLQLSFEADYVIRRISAVLAYSNSAISPTVMLFSMPDLRRMLRDHFGKYFRKKPNAVMDGTVGNNQAHFNPTPLPMAMARRLSVSLHFNTNSKSSDNGEEIANEDRDSDTPPDVSPARLSAYLPRDSNLAVSDSEPEYANEDTPVVLFHKNVVETHLSCSNTPWCISVVPFLKDSECHERRDGKISTFKAPIKYTDMPI